MPTTVNIDLILEEYGRLYQKRGQNISRIHRAFIQGPETLEKHFTHMNIEDDVYEGANDIFEEIVQPYRTEFEAKGGIKMVPNVIVLNHMKVDAKFSPHVIYHSWLEFMANPQNKIENWPITKYFVEVYLKTKINNDRETKIVYKGRYNKNGTQAVDSMDGIKVRLEKGARSTEYPINVIYGVGELNAETVYDQIEEYDEKIGEEYTSMPLIHFVAPGFIRAMKKNKRAEGWYIIDSPDKIDDRVDFTKHVVCGLPSMAGTTDIFTTVKENCLWLTRRNKFDFDLQKEDRYIKVLADWMEGVGFLCNQMVWTTAETVGLGEGIDTASPKDGIVKQNLNLLTGKASDVADTTATLNAVAVGPDMENMTVKFEYGTSKSSLTQVAATESETTPGIFSADISSLTAETKYYFRIAAIAGTDKYVGEWAELTTEETPESPGPVVS